MKYPGYVTIGAAARVLGVSTDTVRRWTNSGTLRSHRLDGKNRYFKLRELKAFIDQQPLGISEVARELGVSIASVRQPGYERKLAPTRDKNGNRQYNRATVEAIKQQGIQ